MRDSVTARGVVCNVWQPVWLIYKYLFRLAAGLPTAFASEEIFCFAAAGGLILRRPALS
jgi:hypothetical protein